MRIHLSPRSRELEPVLKQAASRVNARVNATLSDSQSRSLMRAVDALVTEAARLAAVEPDAGD